MREVGSYSTLNLHLVIKIYKVRYFHNNFNEVFKLNKLYIYASWFFSGGFKKNSMLLKFCLYVFCALLSRWICNFFYDKKLSFFVELCIYIFVYFLAIVVIPFVWSLVKKQ